MVTKKIVDNSRDNAAADIPENKQVASWLGKTRQRLDKGQREFYENIGVKQQTGDNYESGKTPIPAWVTIRAMRRYGDAESLRWWIDLTLDAAVLDLRKISEQVDETISSERFMQWAEGSEAYKTLSPERARRLRSFIDSTVELFARGLTKAEEHLLNQVRVINEIASNATAQREQFVVKDKSSPPRRGRVVTKKNRSE